jgi:effector-binding domain-containing protein
MSAEPQIVRRDAERYVRLTAAVPAGELSGTVDGGFPDLFDWLAERSLKSAGPPFIRYVKVAAEGEIELELGVPISAEADLDEATGDERAGAARVGVGELPPGRYATLLHVGHYEGLAAANAELQDWARQRGINWATEPDGAWSGRLERYLTDPSREPDPSRWLTELAFLLAEPGA